MHRYRQKWSLSLSLSIRYLGNMIRPLNVSARSSMSNCSPRPGLEVDFFFCIVFPLVLLCLLFAFFKDCFISFELILSANRIFVVALGKNTSIARPPLNAGFLIFSKILGRGQIVELFPPVRVTYVVGGGRTTDYTEEENDDNPEDEDIVLRLFINNASQIPFDDMGVLHRDGCAFQGLDGCISNGGLDGISDIA